MATHVSTSTIKRRQTKVDHRWNLFIRDEHHHERDVAH